MKISVLTTWQSRCGIFEYTRKLYDCLKTDNEILILGNHGNISIKSYDRGYKVNPKMFGVYWWSEPPAMNKESIIELANSSDVFHVQYQGSLYKHPDFLEILDKVTSFKVVTIHDSSRANKKDISCFDHAIYHRQDILLESESSIPNTCIPFPTDKIVPKVFSFGMGRNDGAFIKSVCDDLSLEYIDNDSSKSKWEDDDELTRRIKASDVVVLWYNEVPIVGASAAARKVISCHRPLIVNNVKWFSDLVGVPNVYHVSDKENLIFRLEKILGIDYINQNSYEVLANKTMEIFTNGK